MWSCMKSPATTCKPPVVAGLKRCYQLRYMPPRRLRCLNFGRAASDNRRAGSGCQGREQFGGGQLLSVGWNHLAFLEQSPHRLLLEGVQGSGASPAFIDRDHLGENMPAHSGCLITVHSEKEVDRLALSAVRLSTNALLDEAHHGERVHY